MGVEEADHVAECDGTENRQPTPSKFMEYGHRGNILSMDLGGVNHRKFVEMLEDELREGGLLKYKWWLPSLLPERIDGVKNFGMLNQLFFQAMLSGKVDKENPQ